ncbi:unnamed protein product [Peronospora belbahrii]|uniref:Uncharacterized protein n=1 Tax=Peronospora belbahrii TaxID=622444 RepID=A0AAU9KTF2_9STRA|nr:unnamed protein product [Peronospora belbahrii]
MLPDMKVLKYDLRLAFEPPHDEQTPLGFLGAKLVSPVEAGIYPASKAPGVLRRHQFDRYDDTIPRVSHGDGRWTSAFLFDAKAFYVLKRHFAITLLEEFSVMASRMEYFRLLLLLKSLIPRSLMRSSTLTHSRRAQGS